MKALIGLLALLGAAITGAGVWYWQGAGPPNGIYRTVLVERGTLTAVVSAAGPTQAENVVDVGAQNSIPCQIRSFGPDLFRGGPDCETCLNDPRLALRRGFGLLSHPVKNLDYRSPVEAGMILAQLDDTLYRSQRDQAEAEVDQARINVLRAEADLLRVHATLTQSEHDWNRVRKLVTSRGAVSELDYDIARSNYESAKSTLAVGKAVRDAAAKALIKSEAALKQAATNLGYCMIRSPVKGVIIDRRVNVGQTVVSGLTASSLFLIAEDLKRLEVWAAVNEADVGVIRQGQRALFTVDAFPGETFIGYVKEIRLNAQMTQNVVTYPVVVSLDNADERLFPYMTANVRVEVAQHDNILLVPNAALRWKPQVAQIHPDCRDDYARSVQSKPASHKASRAGDRDKEPGTRGAVFVKEGEFVRPIKVRLGLSDGNSTEVLGGDLREGMEVVIHALHVPSSDGNALNNPFAPQIERKK